MRVLRASVSAVSTAALVFNFGLLLESLFLGTGMRLSGFAFGFALSLTAGLAVAFLAGLPIWFILRKRRQRSVKVFAVVGAALAAFTYLLLTAAGMGAPSDRPMSFAENIARPFQIPRIAFVLLAGASGAVVFRHVARGGRRLTYRDGQPAPPPSA